MTTLSPLQTKKLLHYINSPQLDFTTDAEIQSLKSKNVLYDPILSPQNILTINLKRKDVFKRIFEIYDFLKGDKKFPIHLFFKIMGIEKEIKTKQVELLTAFIESENRESWLSNDEITPIIDFSNPLANTGKRSVAALFSKIPREVVRSHLNLIELFFCIKELRSEFLISLVEEKNKFLAVLGCTLIYPYFLGTIEANFEYFIEEPYLLATVFAFSSHTTFLILEEYLKRNQTMEAKQRVFKSCTEHRLLPQLFDYLEPYTLCFEMLLQCDDRIDINFWLTTNIQRRKDVFIPALLKFISSKMKSEYHQYLINAKHTSITTKGNTSNSQNVDLKAKMLEFSKTGKFYRREKKTLKKMIDILEYNKNTFQKEHSIALIKFKSTIVVPLTNDNEELAQLFFSQLLNIKRSPEESFELLLELRREERDVFDAIVKTFVNNYQNFVSVRNAVMLTQLFSKAIKSDLLTPNLLEDTARIILDSRDSKNIKLLELNSYMVEITPSLKETNIFERVLVKGENYIFEELNSVGVVLGHSVFCEYSINSNINLNNNISNLKLNANSNTNSNNPYRFMFSKTPSNINSNININNLNLKDCILLFKTLFEEKQKNLGCICMKNNNSDLFSDKNKKILFLDIFEIFFRCIYDFSCIETVIELINSNDNTNNINIINSANANTLNTNNINIFNMAPVLFFIFETLNKSLEVNFDRQNIAAKFLGKLLGALTIKRDIIFPKSIFDIKSFFFNSLESKKIGFKVTFFSAFIKEGLNSTMFSPLSPFISELLSYISILMEFSEIKIKNEIIELFEYLDISPIDFSFNRCLINNPFKIISNNNTNSYNLTDHQRNAINNLNNINFESFTNINLSNKGNDNLTGSESSTNINICNNHSLNLNNKKEGNIFKESLILNNKKENVYEIKFEKYRNILRSGCVKKHEFMPYKIGGDLVVQRLLRLSLNHTLKECITPITLRVYQTVRKTLESLSKMYKKIIPYSLMYQLIEDLTKRSINIYFKDSVEKDIKYFSIRTRLSTEKECKTIFEDNIDKCTDVFIRCAITKVVESMEIDGYKFCDNNERNSKNIKNVNKDSNINTKDSNSKNIHKDLNSEDFTSETGMKFLKKHKKIERLDFSFLENYEFKDFDNKIRLLRHMKPIDDLEKINTLWPNLKKLYENNPTIELNSEKPEDLKFTENKILQTLMNSSKNKENYLNCSQNYLNNKQNKDKCCENLCREVLGFLLKNNRKIVYNFLLKIFKISFYSAKNVSDWFLYSKDERRYNVELVIALLNDNVINYKELDHRISLNLMNGQYYDFFFNLINRPEVSVFMFSQTITAIEKHVDKKHDSRTYSLLKKVSECGLESVDTSEFDLKYSENIHISKKSKTLKKNSNYDANFIKKGVNSALIYFIKNYRTVGIEKFSKLDYLISLNSTLTLNIMLDYLVQSISASNYFFQPFFMRFVEKSDFGILDLLSPKELRVYSSSLIILMTNILSQSEKNADYKNICKMDYKCGVLNERFCDCCCFCLDQRNDQKIDQNIKNDQKNNNININIVSNRFTNSQLIEFSVEILEILANSDEFSSYFYSLVYQFFKVFRNHHTNLFRKNAWRFNFEIPENFGSLKNLMNSVDPIGFMEDLNINSIIETRNRKNIYFYVRNSKDITLLISRAANVLDLKKIIYLALLDNQNETKTESFFNSLKVDDNLFDVILRNRYEAGNAPLMIRELYRARFN